MAEISKYRKSTFLFIIVGLFFGLFLAACDGTAFVDVSFDATEGVGNIVITGDQDQSGQTQTNGDASMSQILVFGLVVALLLGTAAIVISLARRPRPE